MVRSKETQSMANAAEHPLDLSKKYKTLFNELKIKYAAPD
jgi:hypothetical protein